VFCRHSRNDTMLKAATGRKRLLRSLVRFSYHRDNYLIFRWLPASLDLPPIIWHRCLASACEKL
jgi:hypothetical protein